MEEKDFGWALKKLNEGHKVARKGWNGKGMFIYLVRGSILAKSSLRNEAKNHCESLPVDSIKVCPHIDMKAADDSIVVGWLASQTDMLSDDWDLVE